MKISTPFFLKLIFILIICSQLHLSSNPQTDSGKSNATFFKATHSSRVMILIPADSLIKGLPLLKPMAMEDSVGVFVYELFRDSYMSDAVSLYFRVQSFLINQKVLNAYEPAYLLLSQNQGGFPKFGFYLKMGDSIIDKSTAPYIELVKNNTRHEDYLGSMTQIYPHEMGHIIYRLLCNELDTILPASTDVHYSTLTTDYQTGFNEGFAMHFENMARLYDPDTARRSKILEDLEEKKKSTAYKIKAFTRDFTWPMRLGFYRLSMLTWYQNFEDIKRYEWVSSYQTKFQNRSLYFTDPEKSIQYRNAGIHHDSVLRVPQRAFATEGVIASFFCGLLNSRAKENYMDSSFYSDFQNPLSMEFSPLYNEINPLENQYMKIFYVLFYHVNFSLSVKSQFVDFIEAYLQEFPKEKDIVYDIFYKSTGYPLPIDPGKEIWITNKKFTHGILVMEQFGGITLPFYTFNLNAATEADLLSFSEVKKQEAEQIISFIREKGPLNELNELENISGVSTLAISQLQNNKFDPIDFKTIEEEGIDLSISDLIYSTLKHILTMGGAYCLLYMIISSLILKLNNIKINLKKLIKLFLRFLLFYVIAFVCLLLTSIPIPFMLACSIIIIASMLILMKTKQQKILFTYTTLPVILIFVYALI